MNVYIICSLPVDPTVEPRPTEREAYMMRRAYKAQSRDVRDAQRASVLAERSCSDGRRVSVLPHRPDLCEPDCRVHPAKGTI